MTGNIILSSKGNTSEKTVTEDMEDDLDELPDLDYVKSVAIVFDKMDNKKDVVLPSSIFVDLIETLGEGFHIEELRVICVN